MSFISTINSSKMASKIRAIPGSAYDSPTRLYLVAMEWNDGAVTQSIVTACNGQMAIALHSLDTGMLVARGAKPIMVRVFDRIGEVN